MFVSFLYFCSHFMDGLVETSVPPLVDELPTKYIDLNQISIHSYFHMLFSSRKSYS